MRTADNLPPSCAVVTKSGNLNFLEPSGPVQPCNGTDLPFFYISVMIQVCYVITCLNTGVSFNYQHHYPYYCCFTTIMINYFINSLGTGLLKYSRVHYRLPLLPAANYKADLCRGQEGHIRCFHAGDKRVNEQPGLIALHTIWLRAHNKIATELSHINPHWRDERLYQETRRIIGAILQHISFREFLPLVLGESLFV